jgi:uncharacterized membrane protein
MADFFASYRSIIIFLHVISGVIWVGGMITMRYAVHYSLIELEPPLRLERTSEALKNLFRIVVPFVIILLVTALIMAVAMDLHHGELKMTAFIKEAIWGVMSINLFMMILRRAKAQKLMLSGEYAQAKPLLGLIGSVMVPVNIALGVTAIFLGVTLS